MKSEDNNIKFNFDIVCNLKEKYFLSIFMVIFDKIEQFLDIFVIFNRMVFLKNLSKKIEFLSYFKVIFG